MKGIYLHTYSITLETRLFLNLAHYSFSLIIVSFAFYAFAYSKHHKTPVTYLWYGQQPPSTSAFSLRVFIGVDDEGHKLKRVVSHPKSVAGILFQSGNGRRWSCAANIFSAFTVLLRISKIFPLNCNPECSIGVNLHIPCPQPFSAYLDSSNQSESSWAQGAKLCHWNRSNLKWRRHTLPAEQLSQTSVIIHQLLVQALQKATVRFCSSPLPFLLMKELHLFLLLSKVMLGLMERRVYPTLSSVSAVNLPPAGSG